MHSLEDALRGVGLGDQRDEFAAASAEGAVERIEAEVRMSSSAHGVERRTQDHQSGDARQLAQLRGTALCSLDAGVANSEAVLGTPPVSGSAPRILRVEADRIVSVVTESDLFVARVGVSGSLAPLTGFGGVGFREFELHQSQPRALLSITERGLTSL